MKPNLSKECISESNMNYDDKYILEKITIRYEKWITLKVAIENLEGYKLSTSTGKV